MTDIILPHVLINFINQNHIFMHFIFIHAFYSFVRFFILLLLLNCFTVYILQPIMVIRASSMYMIVSYVIALFRVKYKTDYILILY